MSDIKITLAWLQNFLAHPSAGDIIILAMVAAAPLLLWAFYRGVRS